MTAMDEFLAELTRDEAAGAQACLCAHRRDFHRHGDTGRRCIRPCGCNGFRTDSAQDETAAREAW